MNRIHSQKDTALFVAFDEGGGYWDSGYMQPLDYFGDGPRIPFLVISQYSKHGEVVHTYADHVSILKFIERNWRLAPLTARSRTIYQSDHRHGSVRSGQFTSNRRLVRHVRFS